MVVKHSESIRPADHELILQRVVDPDDAALIQVAVDANVATVTIANPPVNALAQPVRAALLGAIERLQIDDAVNAIVIRGSAGVFVAGADIKEFDAPALVPILVDVVARIEASPKPVVALIEGHALGGGLELAMGCHYRIATANARLGLPEVKLGLLPGAGGTQRLPRLVESAVALEMMLSGEPCDAQRALEIGLIDEIFAADRTQAIDHARRRAAALARANKTPRRANAVPSASPALPQVEIAVLGKYQGTLRDIPSAAKIVECVHRASSVPFDDGVAFARRAFEECRVGQVSRALRHVFFAERAALRAGSKRSNSGVIVVCGDTDQLRERVTAAVDAALDELRKRDVPASALQEALRRLGLAPAAAMEHSDRSGSVGASTREASDAIVSALYQVGKELVSSGSLASPSDFDVLMIHGFGFPRHLGGPVWLAENTRSEERVEMLR